MMKSKNSNREDINNPYNPIQAGTQGFNSSNIQNFTLSPLNVD